MIQYHLSYIGAEESCRCLCVNLSNTCYVVYSFSYVLLRLNVTWFVPEQHLELNKCATKDLAAEIAEYGATLGKLQLYL